MFDIRASANDRAQCALVFGFAVILGVTTVNLLLSWVGHVDTSMAGLAATAVLKFGLALAFGSLAFVIPLGASLDQAHNNARRVIDPGGFPVQVFPPAHLALSEPLRSLFRPPRFLS